MTYLSHPAHRRYNPLNGEWVVVSSHRAQRPWQGKSEITSKQNPAPKDYEAQCYLCPRNVRAGGVRNPDYKDVYVFDNDFPALPNQADNRTSYTTCFENNELFISNQLQGTCKVICYSPKHNDQLADMSSQQVGTSKLRSWKTNTLMCKYLKTKGLW